MLKRGDIIVIDRSWAVERINKKAGSEVCALRDHAKVASHKKAGWLRVRILKNGHVCSVRNIVDCCVKEKAPASILEFHPAPLTELCLNEAREAHWRLFTTSPSKAHYEVLLKDTLDCLKKTTDRKEILRIVADHLMIEGTEQDHLVAGKVLNKTLNWWEQPRRGVRGKVICTCGVIGQSYMTS